MNNVSIFPIFVLKLQSRKVWVFILHFLESWVIKYYTLHEKWRFSLIISSVNLTKSAASCGFGHIYWRNPWWEISFLVQWQVEFCPACLFWCSWCISHLIMRRFSWKTVAPEYQMLSLSSTLLTYNWRTVDRCGRWMLMRWMNYQYQCLEGHRNVYLFKFSHLDDFFLVFSLNSLLMFFWMNAFANSHLVISWTAPTAVDRKSAITI